MKHDILCNTTCSVSVVLPGIVRTCVAHQNSANAYSKKICLNSCGSTTWPCAHSTQRAKLVKNVACACCSNADAYVMTRSCFNAVYRCIVCHKRMIPTEANNLSPTLPTHGSPHARCTYPCARSMVLNMTHKVTTTHEVINALEMLI